MFRCPVALLALSLSLSACGYKDDFSPPQAPGVANASQPPPTYTSIQSAILTPRCGSCHHSPSGQAGVNLDSYDAIVNLTPRTHGHGILVAGHPESSHLFEVVQTGEMPPGGPPLSPQEVQAIGDWIAGGALKD